MSRESEHEMEQRRRLLAALRAPARRLVDTARPTLRRRDPRPTRLPERESGDE